MRRVQIVCFALMVLLVSPCAWAQAGGNSRSTKQVRFSIEEMPEHSVAVPPDVLKVLSGDERVMSCLSEGEGPEKIEAGWFVATPILLRNGSAQDLLVMPNNPCLLGANLGPFWVFAIHSEGFRLVLHTDTHTLELLDSRTKGHRDIRTIALTSSRAAIVVFRFDGKQYRVAEVREKPI